MSAVYGNSYNCLFERKQSADFQLFDVRYPVVWIFYMNSPLSEAETQDIIYHHNNISDCQLCWNVPCNMQPLSVIMSFYGYKINYTIAIIMTYLHFRTTQSAFGR